jgi:hypothetical protein
MKKLQEEYSKNGYHYKLVRRDDKKALYSQSYDNIMVGYEVFKIRIQRARFSQIIGTYIPAHERFPSDSDFGRSAWVFIDLYDALIRYDNI